ncbi:hypothetical protein F0562_009106 [Nyssa sinensis]|uniref:Uncharacterized protein n=1 Tax=Nyssa sinensis TaxID=561372 RepID=A0A5J4ZZ89_9ASTE|nr:hypothetical protein F0562_009106 [Nyssa sinensis]
MKTTLLLLSFFLFAFSANLLLGAADDEPNPVLDVAGNTVQRGVDYYILPVVRGSGGGLTLASNRNGSNCPLDVVQEQQEVDNGLPLTFSPVTGEGVVREITDLNIQFSAATICIQSLVWKLGDFDESVGRSFVTTGGVEGNPGQETLSNWFRIEKDDNDYKIVFCPSVCDICRPLCGDIGIFIENGIRRLALSDEPLRLHKPQTPNITMRTTLLLLSFFLFAFSANPLLGVADDAPNPVLDVAGNTVQTGVDYYILPAIRGTGGGLTLASNRNGSNCPLDVVQEQKEVDNGLPLTFSPVTKEGVVREITDQNIKFSAATICAQSTVWQLGDFDESVRRIFVTTGGVEGNPSRETLSNWFRIEKYDEDYKLVFCPSVCSITCRPLCGDIGIFVENGTRRLALSDEPLKVVFKKA